MSRGIVKSSRFSPGNMDNDSLEKLFVGRTKILENVLHNIEISSDSKEKHFFLIVGPRGSGKTHFVSLVHDRLELMDSYKHVRNKLIISYLNEEEWGIASYLDFLIRILQSIKEPSGNNELENELESIACLYVSNPDKAREFAENLLADSIGEKTLLLICENLSDIFDALGDEGQKRWRSYIQERPFWTILATTPTIFSDVMMQESPFYGFFTIRYFKPIDFDTALDLLCKKAKHEKKYKLLELLKSPVGRARVRAIHHLAGGNHRAYVILFDFLNEESLDDLASPFLRMVDDLTPYYQDRMRQLAPRQRKLTEFLCRHSRPVPVKEISNQCLMSQQTAAKQLGILLKSGLVNKTTKGRSSFYELAEPLMRICIEVKDNRTEHLKLFVEFLRHWFSSNEIDERLENLSTGPQRTKFERIHYEAASKAHFRDSRDPFLMALDLEKIYCYEKDDYDSVVPITQHLVRERGKADDYGTHIMALRETGNLNSALRFSREAIAEFPRSAHIWFEYSQVLSENKQLDDALTAIEKSIKLNPGNISSHCARGHVLFLLDRHDDAINNDAALLKLEPKHQHAMYRKTQSLIKLGRYKESEIQSKRILKDDPESIYALFLLAESLTEQEKYREALGVEDEIISIEPSARIHCNKALTLIELEENDAALIELNQAIDLDPESVRAHCLRSSCLVRLEHYDDAIESCISLLKLDPTHWHAFIDKGRSYAKLHRVKEAETELMKLVEIDGVPTGYLFDAADELSSINSHTSALKIIERIIKQSPDSAFAWIEKGILSSKLGRYDDAMKSLEEVKALDDDPLLYSLLQIRFEVEMNGFSAGLEVLTGNTVKNISNKNYSLLTSSLADTLAIGATLYGPIEMAYIMPEIRQLLSKYMRRGIIGEILTKFISTNNNTDLFSHSEWDVALDSLKASLGDLKQCTIPLNILAVATSYSKTGDEAVLLDLPVEQRELLKST